MICNLFFLLSFFKPQNHNLPLICLFIIIIIQALLLLLEQQQLISGSMKEEEALGPFLFLLRANA